MRFRPCIDIHNGKVKQIVGGSLTDHGDAALENFVSEMDAAAFAARFQKDGLPGGHVILLNAADSPYYEETKQQALRALAAYPGGLAVGGGITPQNAEEYLRAGASHVIVTSYIFWNGQLDPDRLLQMVRAVGKEHLILDLSARRAGSGYYVVTDRWQTCTALEVVPALFAELYEYCDEFLIHGVDVEGKKSGLDEDLLEILAKAACALPGGPCEKDERGNGLSVMTYAGGIATMDDIGVVRRIGRGWVDFTVGSALSLYGGHLSYEDVKHSTDLV